MSDRYSINRRDKKLAGVCSTLGDVFNIDPTFLRIGFAAVAVLVSWKLALIAYVGAGIYLHIQKKKGAAGSEKRWEAKDKGPKGPLKARFSGRMDGLYDDPNDVSEPLTDFDDPAASQPEDVVEKETKDE